MNCAADELGSDFSDDPRVPWLVSAGTIPEEAWAEANPPRAYALYSIDAPMPSISRRAPLWSE